MTAAPKWNLVSVDDYLAGELISPVKHEYLSCVVYAMAGARNAHNTISLNIAGELRTRLRGRPCRPFNSDLRWYTRPWNSLPNRRKMKEPDVPINNLAMLRRCVLWQHVCNVLTPSAR